MLIDETIAAAFAQTKARVIFIDKHIAGMKLWDQTLWFLKHWQKIRARAEELTPGQMVRVNKKGQIFMIKVQQ